MNKFAFQFISPKRVELGYDAKPIKVHFDSAGEQHQLLS